MIVTIATVSVAATTSERLQTERCLCSMDEAAPPRVISVRSRSASAELLSS